MTVKAEDWRATRPVARFARLHPGVRSVVSSNVKVPRRRALAMRPSVSKSRVRQAGTESEPSRSASASPSPSLWSRSPVENPLQSNLSDGFAKEFAEAR